MSPGLLTVVGGTPPTGSEAGRLASWRDCPQPGKRTWNGVGVLIVFACGVRFGFVERSKCNVNGTR